MKPKYVIPNQLECGNIRFHSRRITCLEFHPTNDNVILSGDKVHMLLVPYIYIIYKSKSSCAHSFTGLLITCCASLFSTERSTWDMGLCEAT